MKIPAFISRLFKRKRPSPIAKVRTRWIIDPLTLQKKFYGEIYFGGEWNCIFRSGDGFGIRGGAHPRAAVESRRQANDLINAFVEWSNRKANAPSLRRIGNEIYTDESQITFLQK